jgi:hypothetical protein
MCGERTLAFDQVANPFEAALDRNVPRWRAVSQDPRWPQWLAQRHELTGQPRRRLLDDCVAQGDSRRAAALFLGFLNAYGNTPLSPQAQPQASYQPTGRRIYSRAEISDMSRRRMKGLVSDADWARWEIEMIAAGREGRITGGLPVHGGRAR